MKTAEPGLSVHWTAPCFRITSPVRAKTILGLGWFTSDCCAESKITSSNSSTGGANTLAPCSSVGLASQIGGGVGVKSVIVE